LFGAFFGKDIFNESQRAFADIQSDDVVAGKLQVHFIDVGQGDAALIITPDNKCIIIDAGTNSSQDTLRAYLNSQQVTNIEYAVFTHPHEDHIGGADVVINSFNVKNVILPDAQANTRTYEDMLKAIDTNDVNMFIAAPDDEYVAGDVSFVILAPQGSDFSELNNSSIVLKLQYGDTSFMFTGDAESNSEKAMLSMYNVSVFGSDVLKVGHHGSTSSTTVNFLNAVNPLYAVISCGKGNSYGHPHVETLDKLNAAGVTVLRTDELGTIVLLSDGYNITKYEQNSIK
jgi:competence protein ComEC